MNVYLTWQVHASDISDPVNNNNDSIVTLWSEQLLLGPFDVICDIIKYLRIFTIKFRTIWQRVNSK